MAKSRPFSPVFRSLVPGSVLALTWLLAGALPALASSPDNTGDVGAATPPVYSTYLASPPDLSKFIAEDGKSNQAPYRYGVEVATPGLHLQGGKPSHGVIETLPDGRRVWRVEVVSPGARSLEFAFAKLALPDGAEAFIRSRDGSVSRGPIRAADVQPDGRFFSAFVPGDSAILEVAMAAAAIATTEVRVANVAHAYRDIFDALRGNKSGSCNVDTICPLGDAWRDQIDAVGHYTLRIDGSSAVCTGTLIANTRGDTTPYFLTANHCLSTEAVADTVVVYWNYQSSTCRAPGSAASGTPLPNSIATHTQSGTALVANSAASDFALLRLDAAVPTAANPFWSGWDVRGDAPPSAVTIHHPRGDEKRISDTIIPLTTSAYLGATGSGTSHWRVADWNNGTTEGGSSGSGLWSPSKQLIGQLHGGFAACGNDEPDWYGRLSVSWNGGGTPTTRLRDWLDPIGSGVSTLNGNRATGGGSMVLGGTADEPSASRVTLPTPNPPNASCPAGFFIATVADGPLVGLVPGAFGMELLLDEPGTRVLAGGLNFGGLIDVGQVGFAAFNINNNANVPQTLNLSLTGSPSTDSAASIPVRVRIARRTATTTDVVFESTQTISLATPFVTSINLAPAFYEATVAPINGTVGGAPEGQFFFSLTTSFVGGVGGGFEGGAVVGGYHAAHPFGGVSGFAAFCLATPHTASMRVLSAPSYGPTGARDLRLQILDAQQAVVVTHPTSGVGPLPPGQLANGVAVNGATNSTSANSSFAEYTVVIPPGASNLSIVTTDATADLDLYVRFSQAPSLTTFDCRPFLSSGNESCNFPTPSAGTYFIRVYGFDTGRQTFTIRANWNAP
jgi:hypothetical protein